MCGGMARPDVPEDAVQAFAHGQDIRDRTRRFACRVVDLCKILHDAGGICRPLVPQLLASSTSVAANLEEARAAESTRDFISKCCISLKECRETHVRLKVVANCNIGPRQEVRALCAEAGELVAIISAIVRNTKRNAATRAKRPRGPRISNS
ncbi:MAG: four helix bundle protein [Acidobacteriota bacterium]